MTVKESFDIAGLPTTWGYEQQRNSVARRGCAGGATAEAAGAVVFGKTNVPVSLADWQSYNPIYGTTSQSLEPARIRRAARPAAAPRRWRRGFPALEIGSDIGGSIRVPAHYCGVFGHKPSWGLCSAARPVADAGRRHDRHCGDRTAGAFGATTCRWRSTRSPAPTRCRTSAMSRCRRRARCALPTCASPSGRASRARRRTRKSTALIDALADFLEREGATVSRTARPEFHVTEAFHLYVRLLAAALSARVSEEFLARMRDGQGHGARRTT